MTDATTTKFEEWRPIQDYEGLYEVSSYGRVRRVGRAARHGKGRGGGARIGRVLSQQLIRGTYLTVMLWKNGQFKRHLVHRLVAIAFLGLIPEDREVNHRDGIKQHNDPDNLEYVTRSENNQHAYRTGLMRAGEAHCHARLNVKQVYEIRQLHQAGGIGYRRLAQRFGVHRATIRAIVKKENWTHLEANP